MNCLLNEIFKLNLILKSKSTSDIIKSIHLSALALFHIRQEPHFKTVKNWRQTLKRNIERYSDIKYPCTFDRLDDTLVVYTNGTVGYRYDTVWLSVSYGGVVAVVGRGRGK